MVPKCPRLASVGGPSNGFGGLKTVIPIDFTELESLDLMSSKTVGIF